MTSGRNAPLKAPFPYFGGKSMVADEVWRRFGNVENYVEPFFGSGAVLLGRPHDPGIETINDASGYVSNFWRAVKYAPEEVAEHASWPVIENDLHARSAWLKSRKEKLRSRLEGDPDWYNAKIAGWWCWGMCTCIAGSFGSGDGPWNVVEKDGIRKLLRTGNQEEKSEKGVSRTRVQLSNRNGVNRCGVSRSLVNLGGGQGVHRKLVGDTVVEWMQRLSDRLSKTRVCCGDWSRVCGRSPTVLMGLSGMFFDPPYGEEADRCSKVYESESLTVAHEVRKWCLDHGDDKRLRIAICGYDVEHAELEDYGWSVFEWSAQGGYSNQSLRGNENRHRERIWFSPHCLKREEHKVNAFF